MNRKLLMPLLYVIGLVVVLGFAAMNRAEPEPVILTPTRTSPMTLSPNYRDTYIHYLTVERSDNTVRHVFITPETLEDLQRGEALPVGTQIIIEAYDAKRNVAGLIQRDEEGHFIAGEMFETIHVAEKRTEWAREEIASSTTLNGWNFETFDSETFQPAFENRNECFVCHDTSAFRKDFIFTRNIIDDFIASDGVVQFHYCNRPDRLPCL